MRLVDADALWDAIIRHRPSALRTDPVAGVIKEAVDEALGELDAAPTIECRTCRRWYTCSRRLDWYDGPEPVMAAVEACDRWEARP